ncbi:DUF11 domain-containing protein [Meiothermus sp. QL-1]|uniref:DUF7933 domain-containing protein n=1 Tax=Meiothermus sp. QL-1 TaxID=2058095 RepID=UPI000E0AEBD8|nr:SdrD B-like domain-containing protein [Meiothermus sp. QL-1]RDI96422.1 DUF11 domain-containing protein [Meiothermus sp. QL-1]
MKKLFFLLPLILAPALSQVTTPFQARYGPANEPGNIVLVGNTLMCAGSGSACNTGQMNSPSASNNQSMIFANYDPSAPTWGPGRGGSSSATLTLPTGAQVLWAGLYWGARASESASGRNLISLKPPGATSYQTVTGTLLGTITNQGAATTRPYAAFADVTGVVQTSGSGAYWVGGILANTGNDNLGFYAGWSLVVVYRHPSEPFKNLVVYDGLAVVSAGNNVTITPSGFLTPATGAVNAQIGAVAFEGDGGISGDQLILNGTPLSDAQNPSNNFFNSSISRLGNRFTQKTPDFINQMAVDVDLVDATGRIPNGATSATLQFTSTQDVYFPAVLTFAVNIYFPNLTTTFTKSVEDLNGGNVVVGDILEYTISFTNTGQDGATSVVLRDPIPAGTQYVPGSLQVVSNATGAPTGTFTDAPGDDIAEYSSACSELSGSPPCVRFRLGTGANASQGGLILPTQGASVRFRVRVLPSAAGQNITNAAQISYNAQTLGGGFTQSASASVSTSVPIPPSLNKTFSPPSILPGQISTLRITLSNPNPVPATLTAPLVDNLPAGLVVASPAGVSTTCSGGSVVANPGSSSVTLNSGQILANDSCTVSVNVTGSTPGSYTNTLAAGALQTDLGNNTSAATAVLTIQGLSLSGRVYADREPNGVREAGEDWQGGPTVYVNLIQGSGVVQSVAVNAGTGAYSFSGVAPGSYTLVLSTNPTATTPQAPSGWLFINPAGTRPVTVNSANLEGLDFGLFQGYRISGRLFLDDGRGGGTPNDARQNGGETGLGGVVVEVAGNSQSRSTLTDASGDYVLYVPHSFGSSVALRHYQSPATGSNIAGGSVLLATSYGDPGAQTRVLSGMSSGQVYTGYNFGIVRPSFFQPDQSAQAGSPGAVTYRHFFRPGTLGSATLGVSGAHSYQLRRDANCDGVFDASEVFQPPPLSFTVDAAWPREADGSLRACAIEVRVLLPGGLPAGHTDIAALGLELTWTTNPITERRTLYDTTRVVVGGDLELTKRVRNVSQSTPFGEYVQGRPGEVLEYCIEYRNQGNASVSQVVLTDPIPFFTLYQTGSLRLNSTPLTDAQDADAGEVTGGVVRVSLGVLAAGASGSVCYRVVVR